jgi:hypothetical protein
VFRNNIISFITRHSCGGDTFLATTAVDLGNVGKFLYKVSCKGENKIAKMYDISDSHGGEYDDDSLLGCSGV